MNILVIVIMGGFLAFVSFLCWCLFGFMRYKKQEAAFKQEIYGYFEEGTPFEESLRKSFSEVNRKYNLGLNEYTIVFVVQEISALLNKMSVENVIEIYSMFLNWYIYDTHGAKTPQGIKDERILYAISNLKLKERNGHFVIAPDHGDDFSRKYPERSERSILKQYERIPEWVRWILFFPLSIIFFLAIVSMLTWLNLGPSVIGMISFLLAIYVSVPRFKNHFVVGAIVLRMIISTTLFVFIFITGRAINSTVYEMMIEGLTWSAAWFSYFWVLRKM
ncbi:MAG: hypothetical protein HY210_02325 [Candidatus Omnitrophica bacterium]|nr:hypothetical protein [Candidatus Omnitrophota bacterium]